MSNNINVLCVVFSVIILQNLNASHDSQLTIPGLSQASLVLIGSNEQIQQLSDDDKNYKNLVPRAYTLLGQIPHIISQIRSSEIEIDAVRLFNTVKDQMAELQAIVKKLESYGNRMTSGEMIHYDSELINDSGLITKQYVDYNQQLEQLDKEILSGIQQPELKSSDAHITFSVSPANSCVGSGDLQTVILDDMKTQMLNNGENVSGSTGHTTTKPSPDLLRLIFVDQHKHHKQDHSESEKSLLLERDDPHELLVRCIKICLGTVVAVFAVGITLLILHINGNV